MQNIQTQEKFYDIPSFEGYYQISKTPTIKSLERTIQHSHSGFMKIHEKILTQMQRKDGYIIVKISKEGKTRSYSVHRLVALTFLEKPEGKNYVNHKNSIRNDNRVENLEWVTKSEDYKHAFDKGRIKGPPDLKGEECPWSKITEIDIVNIRNLYAEGYITMQELADKYNLKNSVSVFDIIHRKTWKHVP